MGVYKTKIDGPEPNKWKVEKVADVGASEPFVQGMLDLHPIVDAGVMSEGQHQQVKEAITSILMDGLMPAFLELQQVRASEGQNMPLMDRQQPYEDLARKLWKTYRDLMEKAARAMGFKIGFLFDNDKKFRQGLKEFRNLNPRLRDGFEKFLEATREEWQNELARFRNTWLEHQSGDRRKFEKFYRPEYAETLFNFVWQTIADILPLLLELRLMEGWSLIEQDPKDPGPKWPQRFRYYNPAFPNLK
jgi:hypothetical protein